MNELDRLLTRVIGRDDDAGDWRRLRELAANDPQVWQSLADGLDDDSVLRAALASADSPAAVSLPPAPRRIRFVGWVAAAVFATLWLAGLRSPLATAVDGPATPVVIEPATQPIAEQFVGELPRVVVSTGDTAADGSVEIVYLRRVFERTRVHNINTLNLDETGTPFESELPAVLIAGPRSM
ncbi:MAG: hypothetical protein AB7I19_19370 [Planctomycetota bacterium]